MNPLREPEPGPVNKSVVAAIAAIEERFINFVKEFEDSSAWGEHVDPSSHSDQIGIYGTVAAVEVLGSARYSVDDQLVEDALRSLDVHFPNPSHRWFQKRDFDMTLKRAWLATADCPRVARTGSSELHRQWLIESQLKGSGWGVYTGTADRSTNPEWVSTAFALIALSGHPEFDGSSRCEAAAGWLVGYVSSKDADPADLALARIAVRSVKIADATTRRDVDTFLRESRRPVEAFAKQRRRRAVVTNRTVSHTVGTKEQASATPFNMPRELVVAVDLLQERDPLGVRLAQPFVRAAVSEQGVRTQDRFRTETQLWAIRAFRLMAGVRATRVSKQTAVRLGVLAVCVALVAVDAALPEPESGASILRTALTPVAAIAGSIVASLLLYARYLAPGSHRDG